MFSDIDIHSSVAVYVQIENQVRFAVAAGNLKPDDKLPSIRELSERFKINPNTVTKAFRDLEVMGVVYTRRGDGVYINKGVEGKCREDCRRGIIGRLHEVTAEAKAAGMNEKEVNEIVKQSFASNARLYGETPPALLRLAKGEG